MPSTTRQKILDYLKRNRSVSSREIARALRMTPANARHHLGILAADGRVEVVRRRQVGRGRPEKVYRLAGTLVGDNLAVLADAVLTLASGKIEMESLGKRIAGEKAGSDRSLAQILAIVVERLNAMHYQARWEAGAEGPHIILGHCPYVRIIEQHPELCKMDNALLGELLGRKVDQLAKLEEGAGGVPFCVFAMSQI
jgi:predicted ArsR family transcriptional regulator